MTAETTLTSPVSQKTQQLNRSAGMLSHASTSQSPPMPSIPTGLASANSPISDRAEYASTRKRSAADFQFLQCIGEGSYSKVYRAVSKKNVHTYAIKILNKQHIHKEKKRKYVTIEKNTLNLLGKHPGIVTLYYTFQDPKSLYFVIDFAQNGELLNLIHKLGSLSVELSKYYTIQLIDTIAFIHGKGIIHRDLKPENILLGSDWKLMITDFGAAKFLDETRQPLGKVIGPEENEDSTDSLGSFVGTAEYISPELLKYNQSSFASDFWSLGCIIYQMFVGIPPFKASNEYETFERIVELNYSFPDPHKFPVPSYVVDLVRHLLIEDPNQRFGSESVMAHTWFIDIDWQDKSKLWGPVPKLEPYKPEKHFRLKRAQLPSEPQQVQNVNNVQKHTNSSIQPGGKHPPYAMNSTQTRSPVKRVDVDYINDKPRTVLKKQIINAQNNTHLMNKVLNNRINEKSTIITKKLANPSTGSSTTLNYTAQALSNGRSDSIGSLQVDRKRVGNKPSIPPLPTQKKQVSSPRQNSLSSLLTNNDSAKSVIINSKKTKTPSTTPTMHPLTAFSSNSTVRIDRRVSTDKKFPKSNTNNGGSKPIDASLASSSYSPTMPVKPTMSPKSGYTQLPSFIQKPRVTSSDAAAAAGAIGTLLTHKRHLNSTSSTTTQYKQLHNHQKQLINPVLLDRQIPAIITSKLMQQETILKLDNIFKSEISHKPNQFTAPGETLNHSVLEKLIHKYERDLEKDLKACVLVITSFARLFIYELNDDFRLHNPQSSTQMQALDFFLKIIEIKLTNKNVSLYDYEFDEEIHEGYLILELANVNKLIFLSAWDRSRLVKGGLNSNVRVGFHINENESWVKSFLKAKNLLKKREVVAQNNLNRKGDGTLTKKEQKKDGEIQTKHRSGSTSSMHQSFRKLKLNTHSKIRSLSTSSAKDGFAQTQASSSSSIPSFPSSNASDNSERRQSSVGSHSGSIMNGVKELALGVRAGFKGKESNPNNEGKRIKSDSDVTKTITKVVPKETVGVHLQFERNTSSKDVNAGSHAKSGSVVNRNGNGQSSNKKTFSNLQTRQSREKVMEREKENHKRRSQDIVSTQQQSNGESGAALAAALAVGKKH